MSTTAGDSLGHMTFVQVRDPHGRRQFVPEEWLSHPVLGEGLTLSTAPLPSDCCGGGAPSADTPDTPEEE